MKAAMKVVRMAVKKDCRLAGKKAEMMVDWSVEWTAVMTVERRVDL